MAKPKVYLSVSYQADRMLVSIAQLGLQLAGVETVRYNPKTGGWEDSNKKDLQDCQLLLIVPPICNESNNNSIVTIGMGQANELAHYWQYSPLSLKKIGVFQNDGTIKVIEKITDTPLHSRSMQNDYKRVTVNSLAWTTNDWIKEHFPSHIIPESTYSVDLDQYIAEAKDVSSNQISNDLPELDAALKEYKINIHTNGSTNTQYIPTLDYISNDSNFKWDIISSINLPKTPTYSSENNYKIAATAIAIQDEPKITSSDAIKPMLALYALLKF